MVHGPVLYSTLFLRVCSSFMASFLAVLFLVYFGLSTTTLSLSLPFIFFFLSPIHTVHFTSHYILCGLLKNNNNDNSHSESESMGRNLVFFHLAIRKRLQVLILSSPPLCSSLFFTLRPFLHAPPNHTRYIILSEVRSGRTFSVSANQPTNLVIFSLANMPGTCGGDREVGERDDHSSKPALLAPKL